MNLAFYACGIFVAVAAKAKGGRRRGDQLHVRRLFANPHFMTAQTTCLHGRVNSLPFGLVRMALEALGRVHIRFEGNGMFRGDDRTNENCQQQGRAESLEHYGHSEPPRRDKPIRGAGAEPNRNRAVRFTL